MVYMYHSFLIHSSADGHLGCFHALAIINSAGAGVLISWLQPPSTVTLEPKKIVCHCFPICLPSSDGTDAMILIF